MIGEGQVQVTLSPDAMEAYLTLRPGKDPASLEQVNDELARLGIQKGVDWQAIRDALYALTQEAQSVKNLRIAKGKQPVPGLTAGLVFHPKIRSLDPRFQPPMELQDDQHAHPHFSAPHDDDEATVDFRDVSAFLIVKKGQVLAIRRDEQPGEFGESLTGETIPYKTIEVKTPEPGENTQELDGKILSAVDGRFHFSDKEFGVSTVIELGEGVGYGTGHIRFPGDLRLKGRIQDRFSVWVGGSISASVTLDCWDVFAGGSLQASEGIIGRGKAQLRIKGNLEAKFIENCNVDVLGDVRVGTGCLNSRLYCNGRLSTGDKGKLVGGEFFARRGLECYVLGNDAELATDVFLGLDFVSHRKLLHYREQVAKLSLERQDVQSKLESVASNKLQGRYQQLVEEELRLNAQIEELLPQQEIDFGAELIVRGTIHPGVKVHLGSDQVKIEASRSKVRILVPEGQTKLAVVPLA